MTSESAVVVKILEREFKIACAPSEREALLRAAAWVDGKMRELKDGNKTMTVERLAVLTALNLAHELLSLRHEQAELSGAMQRQLDRLAAKLEDALRAH